MDRLLTAKEVWTWGGYDSFAQPVKVLKEDTFPSGDKGYLVKFKNGYETIMRKGELNIVKY